MEAGVEELYAVEEDPSERKNLVESYPEVAKNFQAEIQDWIREMRAPYLVQ